MGDDDFNVSTSDQTASEPASEPEASPPQLENLDDTSAPQATNSSVSVSPGDQDSGESGDTRVDISDDTAHAPYQPPVDPEVTIGPDERSGSSDDRPEEQHDEERDNPNERIEEDSNREAEPEPPSGE